MLGKSPAWVDYKVPVGLIFRRMKELPVRNWGFSGGYDARRDAIFRRVLQRMERQDASTAVAVPNVIWSRPRRGDEVERANHVGGREVSYRLWTHPVVERRCASILWSCGRIPCMCNRSHHSTHHMSHEVFQEAGVGAQN